MKSHIREVARGPACGVRWTSMLRGPALSLCLGLAALPGIVTAQVPDREIRMEGTLFRPGSERREVLYHWSFHQDAVGTWRTRYLTPAETVAAEDELMWTGGLPVAYRYVRKVAGEVEVSSVELAGDRLVFTSRRGGKEDRAEEPLNGLFAVGPSLAVLVQTHWSELAAGERLRVQYGVLDQLRTFTFDVFRIQDVPAPGQQGQAVIRMRIANYLLRIFLDPIDLVFSPAGDVLREIRGRALPIFDRDGSPRPVDAELVISNPQPVPR